jgi:Alcohol dehydrogenase GroES-like domain
MKTIVMNGTGGREMLDYVERPDPVAGPGQAPVEIAFAGVNFMDIGVRQGTVWNEMPNPKILGVEGVGRVVADTVAVSGKAIASTAALQSPQASPRGQIPIASAAPPPSTFCDFVPWRFSDACRHRPWMTSSCRRPRNLHRRRLSFGDGFRGKVEMSADDRCHGPNEAGSQGTWRTH